MRGSGWRYAPPALAGILLCLAGPALAARQTVMLFPPAIAEGRADNVLRPALPILEQTLKEKLEDRFDVRPAGEAAAPPKEEQRRHRARTAGASYILSGNIFRIGKAVTLDVTIAPTEEPTKGRTVVVSGTLENPSPLSTQYAPFFRNLATEMAVQVKSLFFGEGGGGGTAAKKIPGLAGTITRSAPLPGEVVSAAASDLDLDGKIEIVAAYADAIAIYQFAGDDLREKARIRNAGTGIIHVDAAAVTRNGVADIVVTRFTGGKALSDIWQYEGKEYRKISTDLPYFLRVADLGLEGVVLLGQESDPEKVYRGPVFRLAVSREGKVGGKGRNLPLPQGTFLYGFAPLRQGKKDLRYAVLTSRERLVYLDAEGKELWEGLDAVTGSESALETSEHRVPLPPRMVSVDLNRDGTDELVVLNDLVAAGTYFENLRVYSQVELLCFAQGEKALQLAWRSPQSDASARDLLVDRSNPNAVRFAVASRDRGKLVGGAAQWRILWVK